MEHGIYGSPSASWTFYNLRGVHSTWSNASRNKSPTAMLHLPLSEEARSVKHWLRSYIDTEIAFLLVQWLRHIFPPFAGKFCAPKGTCQVVFCFFVRPLLLDSLVPVYRATGLSSRWTKKIEMAVSHQRQRIFNFWCNYEIDLFKRNQLAPLSVQMVNMMHRSRPKSEPLAHPTTK